MTWRHTAPDGRELKIALGSATGGWLVQIADDPHDYRSPQLREALAQTTREPSNGAWITALSDQLESVLR